MQVKRGVSTNSYNCFLGFSEGRSQRVALRRNGLPAGIVPAKTTQFQLYEVARPLFCSLPCRFHVEFFDPCHTIKEFLPVGIKAFISEIQLSEHLIGLL